MNTTIRMIQIDLITDSTNPIIEWFNDIWNRIISEQIYVWYSNYNEIIHYVIIDNEKQWVFYQNDEANMFWCNYKYFWYQLEDKFGYGHSYFDLQLITKMLVENAIGEGKTIPTPHNGNKFMTTQITKSLLQ